MPLLCPFHVVLLIAASLIFPWGRLHQASHLEVDFDQSDGRILELYGTAVSGNERGELRAVMPRGQSFAAHSQHRSLAPPWMNYAHLLPVMIASLMTW